MTHDIQRANAALWSIDPSAQRGEWFKVAAAAKSAGVSFLTFHEWSSGAPNYKSEQDCRTAWNSAKDGKGVGEASLFFMAQQAGWREEKTPKGSLDPKAIWDECVDAQNSHAYVQKKLGLPDGLRTYTGTLKVAGNALDGSLVVPARTLSGQIVSLQFITADNKLFLPKAKLGDDGCFVVGKIGAGDVYLCEGIGQAWAAHQATGKAAVVSFGWGRIANLAKAITKAYPNARVVIVPDGGKESDAEKAARTFGCAYVPLPTDWENNQDINDLQKSKGLEAVRSLLAQSKHPRSRFELLTPEQLVEMPQPEWCVKRVLQRDGIAAIFGAPASGKSFLTLDLMAHVAAGKEWFGFRTYSVPVVYVALEGEQGVAHRVKAWVKANGALPEKMRVVLSPLSILKDEDRAELVTAIKSSGYAGGILCLDTLNRATSGADENSSTDMGLVIEALKQLQSELGGLVLAVHHSGKDASRGLRGHSSLAGALDTALEVTRTGAQRGWKLHKQKDGDDSNSHAFALTIVELGTDTDGEAVTSCVVRQCKDVEAEVKSAKVPIGGNQRLVWDAVGELLRKRGDGRPQGAPTELPFGRPCVTVTEAVAFARERLVTEEKRKTERTQKAITDLCAKGMFAVQEGYLWVK